MKPINMSIFDFPTLLAKQCVYVDKTAQIYEYDSPIAGMLDTPERRISSAPCTRRWRRTSFHEHIQAFADERGETYDEAFAELLAWYDSCQFSPKRLVKVINPVSLGNALSSCVLKGCWVYAEAAATIKFDVK